MSLKTNYKDYELAPSMGGQRHYRVTENADGTQSLTDVSEYLEIGDSFKAEDINATNSAVNDLANTPNDVTDLKMLGYTIPKEMPIKNYTDSNRVYHQRVGRVCLNILDWKVGTDLPLKYYYADITDMKLAVSGSSISNMYLDGYKTVSTSQIGRSGNDKSIANHQSLHRLFLQDSSITDVNQLKSSTKYLYYELATEITKSVDGNEALIIRHTDFVLTTDGSGYKHLDTNISVDKFLGMALIYDSNIYYGDTPIISFQDASPNNVRIFAKSKNANQSIGIRVFYYL